ncbi:MULTISPECIES: NADP-dependent oxidoreductase [Gammaproteobacteria]|uniref:NADP-dependent oxidoreductase n=1 Tax=Gammaproteobacteria TaxID=1236 RepID=UPI001C633451|nr:MULTISPECIES: NADP-dependent oxidoreductase [Gammaproteobacteria]MEE1978938.1 NADP-dependent oxidoreductase [Shewanella xiamenensis]QYH28447.1 NADP-dependent oxidoreductase [Aeromonas salmonicida subsp. masoucida]QYH32765.1 NADP-dependent oxidoreductase [Aeromonas salmonicida subsp. masoucida]
MKAVRIHQYGNADVLRYEDAPLPELAADDVRVRVIAAGVNPVDWKIREGYLQQMIPYDLPLTLGWDVSGIIESVGSAVQAFKPGDAIYARPDIKRNGSYAEFIDIRASEIAHKPRTLSHAAAASLPLAAITAWDALFTAARLRAGQSVLIHAASGGVGSLAVQLAKNAGARVIATCSAKNHALVRSLGADQLIDYQTQRLADIGAKVDVVFDTLGGDVQTASWSLLKPGGILVSVVSPPTEEAAQAAGADNVRSAFVFIEPNAKILEELADMVDAGRIRPLVGAEFALRDAAKAHALSQSGRAVGKIVLHVGQP